MSEKEELVVVLSFEYLNWNFQTTMGIILKPRRTFVFLHSKIVVGGLKRKKLRFKNSSCEGEDRETLQDFSSFSGKGKSLHSHSTLQVTVPFH